MLDLDQSGNIGQKPDRIALAELVWENNEQPDDEWLDFTIPEKNDDGIEMFEELLVMLR